MKSNASLMLAAVLALASCSSENDKSAEATTQQATRDGTARADRQNDSTAPGFDVASVDVCELLPAETVAASVGGQVLKPAERSDYGTSQGCEYEIDPSGADTYEYGAVWLGPPSYFSNSQERMETDRGLGQQVTAEPLNGFGDQAYVIHNATEKQSTIYVLLRNEVYIEVRAERYEDARKVAQLALSRI